MISDDLDAGNYYVLRTLDGQYEALVYVEDVSVAPWGTSLNVTYYIRSLPINPNGSWHEAPPNQRPWCVNKGEAIEWELDPAPPALYKGHSVVPPSACQCGATKCGSTFHSSWCPCSGGTP